jgi:hypothetical protein
LEIEEMVEGALKNHHLDEDESVTMTDAPWKFRAGLDSEGGRMSQGAQFLYSSTGVATDHWSQILSFSQREGGGRGRALLNSLG